MTEPLPREDPGRAPFLSLRAGGMHSPRRVCRDPDQMLLRPKPRQSVLCGDSRGAFQGTQTHTPG